MSYNFHSQIQLKHLYYILLNTNSNKYKLMRILLHFQTVLRYLGKQKISDQQIQQILEQKDKLTEFKIQFIRRVNKNSSKKILIALLSVFLFLCTLTISFNLMYLGLTISQPFFNSLIKQLISQQQFQLQLILKIVAIVLGFKLISTFIIFLNDVSQQYLGVRLYSMMTSLIITHNMNNISRDGIAITNIQDDCQRIVLIPYSFITVFLKSMQFGFFVGFIILSIPQYQLIILLIYSLFLILCSVSTLLTSYLNLKILSYKQIRLNFQHKTYTQINNARQKQIKYIRMLMVLDGITIYLPEFINISTMILVYSIDNLDKDTRYILLIVYGLLRSNIAGFGFTYNMLAQILSSLHRIVVQLRSKQTRIQQNQPLAKVRGPHTEDIQRSESSKLKLNKIFKKIIKNFPCFNLIFGFLLLCLCGTNFMYGFCAKSLTNSGSVFEPLNLITLILQFTIPGFFFAFICYNSTKLSSLIYQTMMGNHENLSNLSPQQMNRLSGDTRQLDRQLYMATNMSFTALSRVISSLIFTVVQLNNNYFALGFIIFIIATFWCFYKLFRKVMNIRRNIYIRQTISKGNLLSNLQNKTAWNESWLKIHNYKQYGYLVQNFYIFILYIVMSVLITLLIFFILMISSSHNSILVLIMMCLQLDSQLFIVCINWIQFQIALTSTQRCITMMQKFQHSEITILDSQSQIKKSLIQQQ